MLPDLPGVKQRIAGYILRRLRHRTRDERAPFSGVKEVILHEGNRLLLIRDDGSRSLTKFKAVETPVTFTTEEVDNLTPGLITERMDKAAGELAGKMKRHFYSMIDQTCRQTGNSINMKGQPFTSASYLEMLRRLQMDFTPDGRLQIPTLTVGEKLAEKIRPEVEKALASPEFAKLVEGKRAEWRDRESNRKLAD